MMLEYLIIGMIIGFFSCVILHAEPIYLEELEEDLD